MVDFEAANGDVRIRIEGIREAIRALDAAGADMQEMRDLMHRMGEIVASKARSTAPYRSGRLQGNIRSGRGKTKAVIRAGGARVPYAPIVEYGWPARNIGPNTFMTKALHSTLGQVLNEFDKGLAELLKKNGLT